MLYSILLGIVTDLDNKDWLPVENGNKVLEFRNDGGFGMLVFLGNGNAD